MTRLAKKVVRGTSETVSYAANATVEGVQKLPDRIRRNLSNDDCKSMDDIASVIDATRPSNDGEAESGVRSIDHGESLLTEPTTPSDETVVKNKNIDDDNDHNATGMFDRPSTHRKYHRVDDDEVDIDDSSGSGGSFIQKAATDAAMVSDESVGAN